MICISPIAPFGDLARTSPAAFNVYDCAYPAHRDAEATRGFLDEIRKWIAGSITRCRLCGSHLGYSSRVTHGQPNEQWYDCAQLLSNKRKRDAVLAPVQ